MKLHSMTLCASLMLTTIFPLSAIAADATASAMASSDATAMSSGEVKKVDKDAGKITIKHGPLANLEMPAMTMVFHVKDAAMLSQVKKGDQIHFVAEKDNGALTVMKMELAK